jgi:hypothetical protein
VWHGPGLKFTGLSKSKGSGFPTMAELYLIVSS